jgi:hypothetical protein
VKQLAGLWRPAAGGIRKAVVSRGNAGKMNLKKLQEPTQAGSFFSKARHFPG